MRPSLHLQRIIGSLALLAFLLTIVGVWLFAKETRPTGSDLLPRTHTLAYVRNVDDATLRHLLPLFPALSTVSLPSDMQADLAIVQYTGGAAAQWMVFGYATDPDQPIVITTSSPQIRSLLSTQQTGDSLSKTPAFRALASLSSSEHPWAFLQFPLLRLPKDLPLALQTPSSPLSLSWKKNTVIFSGISSTPLPSRTLQTHARIPTAGAVFTAHAADLQWLLSFLEHALTPSQRMIAQSLLKEQVRTIFGSNVSMRYDLFPLLAHEASLRLQETGSGTLRFLLEGSLTPDARTTLEALPTALRHQHIVTEHIQKTLGDDLSFETMALRENPPALERTELGWDIASPLTTPHGMLQRATRSARFLLGTDTEGFLAALRIVPPPHSSTQILAEGTFDLPGFLSLLHREFPDLAPLPPTPSEPREISWRLERTGSIFSWILRAP